MDADRDGWTRTDVVIDSQPYIVSTKGAIDHNGRVIGYRCRLGSEVVHPSVDAALDVALRAITKLGLGYRERVF